MAKAFLSLFLLVWWWHTAAAQTAAPAGGEQPIFKAEARLVVLHVSVQDRGGRYLTGLAKEAFTVIDDGRPQVIEMFSADEVPASIGLLVDNSNSMAPSRERVIAAVSAFARHSQPRDEVFVLTVNEHVREAWAPAIIADTPPRQFEAAITRAITARGMTALYDGVAEGLRRVRRGTHSRQVLILVSDGGDNASQVRQEDIVREARASDAVIYTVGLADGVLRDGNPGLLRQLARDTGGIAFEPRRANDVPATLERIARDIRSAYTLAYTPTPSAGKAANDRWRPVQVYVRSPDGRPARVRARDGYLADPDGSPR